MPHDRLSPTPLISRLTLRDTPLQASLRQKLVALNIELFELLQRQPTFHALVQQAFDHAFPDRKPLLDIDQGVIQYDEQETRAIGTPLPENSEPVPEEALVPRLNLMEAVVQRMVANQASGYASRPVSFHARLTAEGEWEPVTGLTPSAFDRFLDQFADGFSGRYQQSQQAFLALAHGPTEAHTIKQQLIKTRTEQLSTELALLSAENLLSATAQALFAKVLKYPNALARQALGSYRPCVYGIALKAGDTHDIPLYGAFILTARDPQDTHVGWQSDVQVPQVRPIEPAANVGTVVVFTPGAGLEEFASLSDLDRELHRRLSHGVAFPRILAMVAQDQQSLALARCREGHERGQFKYLERLDSPFDYAIESQCLHLQQNVAATLARYQTLGLQADSTYLSQSLDEVMDLTRAFDGAGALFASLEKRGQAQIKAFLSAASQSDKDAWSAASAQYYEQLANLLAADGLPSWAQFSDKSKLLAYANQQLRQVLVAEYGLDINPDHILVHTQEAYVPPSVIVPGAPGHSIREPGTPLYKSRSRSLTQLALENVGGLDLNFINFSRLTEKTEDLDKPDEALRPEDFKTAKVYEGLTVEQVRDLVRGVNVGGTYGALLRERLITSPQALAQKKTYVQVLAHQLRLDAIEARIAGDFLPDRLERGFNWVRVVLDEPIDSDQRERVEGHRILVEYLKLRGQRVRGVLMLRTASAGGGSVVVYTPQAPTGRVFHEYPDETLIRDFVHSSSWREYLVSRVERAFQPQVRAVLRGRGDTSMVHFGRIDNNFMEDAYEVDANFVINDAQALSTSTHQTNVETALTVATTAFDIASMVLPIKIMLPIGLARSLFSVFNGVESANLGDRTAAANHFVRAFGELVGALVDGAIGSRSTGAGRATTIGQLNPHMALAKKPDGVLPLKGWEGKGVYFTTSKDGSRLYFINQHQHWYSILDDGAEQAWRIRDVRKPPQYYYDPIRLDASGTWHIGSHPGRGLKGGQPPHRALMEVYPFFDEAQAWRVLDSFNFPRGQEIAFGLDLVYHLRSGVALDPFHPYLMITPERLASRLRGGDSPGRMPQALTVDADRAPLPRPSPDRLPHERFVEWGQTIDAAELNVLNAERDIVRRIPGNASHATGDYIRIDERCYPILPIGGDVQRSVAYMRNPNLVLDSFDQFEHMLRTDLFNQPRLTRFYRGINRWINQIELPFRRTISAYVAGAFPMLHETSQLQVARALFRRANPSGLTAWGYRVLQVTLNDWVQWPSSSMAKFGDPLLLLPITGRTGRGWHLGESSGFFGHLRFRTDPVALLLHNTLTSGTEGTLRALMIEVLTRSRYQILDGYNVVGELLFTRPGRDTVYWMSLRRAQGNWVDEGVNVQPRVQAMQPDTRNLVARARVSNNFVILVGGVRSSVDGGEVSLFIFRARALPGLSA
ncbi:hypothetical protein K7402_28695 [Pseudomonas fluorescens group sp.]|uniref:Dermonecrotic toxin N-terminal domain-containing protein n=2 Tax=Pseudomonas fluorescens TaxID=294 RepID=C3JZ89_PSEFS|nr:MULTISPECIES: DUF6543 domain-containing protein [Pseudomonas fluorescens group]MBZ6459197.1 hypothetical protein [Pseudomonas fluorescens group sp.]MBZ6464427.1 hypothetical protein [Pseudomonas fluorescens group sp.]MBZ6471378.1 hypothetical protein [Pseudomonas fluorescens group sp.]WQD71149.1 DUF6543 domain-containing protein [Pseudomonas marginalis]CAI2799013.1 Uncharacterized protein PFLU_4860 [Pseudomonas fluorescens SBW25]